MTDYELQEKLKGKKLTEAKASNLYDNYTFRVINNNNNPLSYTMDQRSNRINVNIYDGVITEVVGLF